MKQIIFYALAAGLALSAGCKKGEDGTTEMMSAEEIADTTQEAAVQATEKAAEVTETATAAVSAITVKAEDVMGDLNQSVDEIKQKVAAFDKTQVMAYADQYKNVLLEKKDQIADLTGQLKGLSMTEMMGDKAKLIKDQITLYSDQFAGLKDRYSIYLEKLESFGVDLSAYTL
jgi:predicted Zn-dependent protease with MMP-like domain